MEIVALMFIREQELKEDDILFVSLRGNLTSLCSFQTMEVKRYKFGRFFRKLGFDINTFLFSEQIRNLGKPFIVYGSWLNAEMLGLLSMECCVAHNYLEEGQLSHWDRKLAPTNHKSSLFSLPFTKVELAARTKYLHREDAKRFVCIDPNAFKKIDARKKITLNNFDAVKRIYEPKLLGVKHIGIGPAWRRLIKKDLTSSLIELSKYLPYGATVKLHPSFKLSDGEKATLVSKINQSSSKNLSICDDTIILEAEMMFETKSLYGAKSSLSRYCDLLGSSYQHLKLY